jgi:uncharacterized protein (DUF1778 family)
MARGPVRRTAIQARVTEEEKERIERVAAADRRTISDWARLALIRAVEEYEAEEERKRHAAAGGGDR